VLGDDTAAIVARAEARLAAGDLYAAVQQLAALQGPAAAAAQDWLAPANARLAAQQAMAGLTAQLTRAIAE
jgi:uroporphyrinogen-III synthase